MSAAAGGGGGGPPARRSPKKTGRGEPAMVCANCGESASAICTACKSVRYCNRECQLAHRKVHKAECKRVQAEREEWTTLLAERSALRAVAYKAVAAKRKADP